MKQIFMEYLSVIMVVLFKQTAQYAQGKVNPQSCADVLVGIPSDGFSSSV